MTNIDINKVNNYIKNNKKVTIKKLAESFGVTYDKMYIFLRKNNIKLEKVISNRDEKVINIRNEKHLSYTQIGNMFGISRQRVEQIINRHN